MSFSTINQNESFASIVASDNLNSYFCRLQLNGTHLSLCIDRVERKYSTSVVKGFHIDYVPTVLLCVFETNLGDQIMESDKGDQLQSTEKETTDQSVAPEKDDQTVELEKSDENVEPKKSSDQAGEPEKKGDHTGPISERKEDSRKEHCVFLKEGVVAEVQNGAVGNGHTHTHSHGHSHGHGHEHSHDTSPGMYSERPQPQHRTDWNTRAFSVGIGGPVGSGKTALVLALCRHLRDSHSICVVTNDIFTREDWDFLVRNEALPKERMRAVETGGCPHAAIREDFSLNMLEVKELTVNFKPQIVFIESGGDNLAANFSRELADFIIYVIDVAGGDKIPRKGGPGITQSDLLVINKTDLAEAVGADLGVMTRDSKTMRQDGPTIFTQAKHGEGISEVANTILEAYRKQTGL